MRMMPAVLVVCAAILQAAPSRADDAAEQEARSLFAQGNERVQAGDFNGALERFRAAYALLPRAKILLNVGTMLRELGRSAEAADAYEAYLRAPDTDPGRKAEVEALLRELDARVAKLRIEVSDPGMRVRIGDRVVGDLGMKAVVRVEPGSHQVIAEKDGAEPVVEAVTVVAGEERVVSLRPKVRLQEAPRPPAAPSVGVSVQGGKVQGDRAQTELGLSHDGQIGGVVRADIDGQGRGVAIAVGASYGVSSYVEIGAGSFPEFRCFRGSGRRVLLQCS